MNGPLATPLQQVGRIFVHHDDRALIYFGGCDYFRLASHPAVLDAFQDGAERFGLNVAASRMTTGNHALYGQLETALAKFFDADQVALFSAGYATNLAFAQAFAGHFTHALIDARTHGSGRDAAALLACPVQTFAHRDVEDFRRVLKACGRHAHPLVLTDGMFSHDGSIAPLAEYLAALPRGGMVLVDDAHGAGTLGRTGRGTPEVCGVSDARVVQTISLSKAFGVYGGAVLGSAKIIRALRERSRLFSGNTPLPLPLANAALTSVRLLQTDRSLRRRLNTNTACLKVALLEEDYPVVDNASPLATLVPRDARHAALTARRLLRAGIFPSHIRYPGGPPDGYFRFAISSEHTPEQLDQLAQVLLASA